MLRVGQFPQNARKIWGPIATPKNGTSPGALKQWLVSPKQQKIFAVYAASAAQVINAWSGFVWYFSSCERAWFSKRLLVCFIPIFSLQKNSRYWIWIQKLKILIRLSLIFLPNLSFLTHSWMLLHPNAQYTGLHLRQTDDRLHKNRSLWIQFQLVCRLSVENSCRIPGSVLEAHRKISASFQIGFRILHTDMYILA
mgnify:CR=1 FL=1